MPLKLDPADRYFSIWVRLRDKKCVRCGSGVSLNDKGLPVSHQNSHFQSRRKEATRFDPLNADCLCGGCHMYLGGNPYEHYEWQVERKGKEVIEALVLASNQYHKKDRKSEALYWKQMILTDYGLKA